MRPPRVARDRDPPDPGYARLDASVRWKNSASLEIQLYKLQSYATSHAEANRTTSPSGRRLQRHPSTGSSHLGCFIWLVSPGSSHNEPRNRRCPRALGVASSRIDPPTEDMTDIRRGLIIVNTGPGKGKTTAAMGTALRAVGQGMRVLMLQFLKGSWHYGELDAVKAFGDKFVLKQMGRGFVKVGAEKPDPEDVRMVEEAWAEAE